jgi:hypothetical protein
MNMNEWEMLEPIKNHLNDNASMDGEMFENLWRGVANC